MISLIDHDFQWGRSEVVMIYPYIYIYIENSLTEQDICPTCKLDG